MTDSTPRRGLILTRLRHVRQMRTLTQRELADVAGVTRQTIARGERGEAMELSTVRRLAEVLKADVEELL